MSVIPTAVPGYSNISRVPSFACHT